MDNTVEQKSGEIPESTPEAKEPPGGKPEGQQTAGSGDPSKNPKPAKYVRRSDWGAKPPKWIEALETPVRKVVLTWTETDGCATEEECIQRVKEIQEQHMKDEDCPDIKHNFLVGGDGALYEGRGYTRLGPKYPKNQKTHDELYGKSIEIAFIQRHVGTSPYGAIKAASDCIAWGTNPEMRWIEDKLLLYWVQNSIIKNKYNASLTKEGNLMIEAQA